MEFRQILYFDAVFRNKSISKAAQELFVTQQCVSKQVSLLEKELGTALLLRSQSGVSPTEEGQWFHEHAAMILQLEQDIQTHYETARKASSRALRIGVSNGLNTFFDDMFFRCFQEKHPGQNVQVFYMWNQQIEELLETGTIDLGVSLLPVQNNALLLKKLFTEQLYCIVNKAHPLATREVLHFEDIMAERIAMADENFNTYRSFMLRCEEKNIRPDVYKASDLMSIYIYVLNHNAVGFSLRAFADRFNIDQIRHIPYEDEGGVWDVCLLSKEKNQAKYSSYVDDFRL